jgi:uncharacterized protein (TIGR02145 family)
MNMITSLSTKDLRIMNRVKVLLMLLLLISGIASAQSPNKFSYQAIIRAIGGHALTNQSIGMRLSILQGSDNGTAVYVETHTATTNAQCLVTVQVGGGNVQSGSIAQIDWANGPYFVKTETDPEGGSAYTISGTSPLLSVPYSLFSSNGVEKGTNFGDMMFWDGSNWVKVPIGQENQVLTVRGGKPSWTNNYGGSFGEVSDIEGNTYKTVKIGNQTWMAEDLNATKFSNGEAITLNLGLTDWNSTLAPRYTIWEESSSIYYNGWTLIDSRNVCPTGWKVPANSDFTELISYLGPNAGKKLKSKGFSSWLQIKSGQFFSHQWRPEGGTGTNSSGFNADGVGVYNINATYNETYGNVGIWGTKTQNSNGTAFDCLWLQNPYDFAQVGEFPKNYGVKVRCIKD